MKGLSFKKNSFLHLFLLGSVGAMAASPSPHRPAPENVGYKAMEFEISGSLFDTTSHYDTLGKRVPLNGDTSFKKLEGDFSARYGITRQLEFRTGLRARKNTAVVDDPSRGKFFLDSEGVESYMAGAKYTINYDRLWLMALDFYYRQAAFTVEEYDSTRPYQSLDLGDEVKELAVGLHLSQRFQTNPIITYSAYYQRRTNDFSSEILYQVEGAYRKPRWAMTLGVEGIYSLKTDAYSDNPSAKPPSNTGSTKLYNSVNRAHLSPFVGLYLQIASRWVLKGKFRRVVYGVSTDEGNEGTLALVWRLPGVSEAQAHVESFKEYEVEATVVKISPRGIFIKIDKGVGDDIQKGMVMDIYQFDYMGGNVLTASGIIYEVDAESSVIKLVKKYLDNPIKVGFVARGKISTTPAEETEYDEADDSGEDP